MQKEIQYLRSLQAVRDRTAKVRQKAIDGKLQYFEVVEWNRVDDVVQFVSDLIRRDYASPKDVPAHSRWRHFDVGGYRRIQDRLLPKLQQTFAEDPREIARTVLDLFVVSVLLDAGAGDQWKYAEKETGLTVDRSEGLAVASLDMFMHGSFSSQQPWRCDAKGLKALTVEQLKKGLQVDDKTNPLVGLQGRCSLLNRLGEALIKEKSYFPCKDGNPRPGHLLDYLLQHPTTTTTASPSSAPKPAEGGTVEGKPATSFVVKMDTLWQAVMEGFKDVWPEGRTKIHGVPMGDVWPCDLLRETVASAASSTPENGTTTSTATVDPAKEATAHLIPFHKLSQWLTYSLMEPMQELLQIRFDGLQKMTGLPEYRNGGLFVDFGVLTLKKEQRKRGLELAQKVGAAVKDVPMFEPSDPVIIEWYPSHFLCDTDIGRRVPLGLGRRAMTVVLLDMVGEKVRKVFGLSKEEMPLVKVLEGGTWKAGREIAAKKRPATRGPPIQILSDGTVF